MDRPRAIFDCNVLVQAVLNRRGASRRCIELVDEGEVLLLLSAEAIAEARLVFARPFVRARTTGAESDDVAAVLSRLTYRAELIRHVPRVQDWPRDPKDALYLDLAIAAAAEFLVTNDSDLLTLAAGDHSLEAKQFRQRTRNRLSIVTPAEFLHRVRSGGGP